MYNLRNYLPPTFRVFLAEKISRLREFLVNNGVLAPPDTSTDSAVPESPALSSARSSLSSARSALSRSESSLNSNRSDIEKSNGPSDVFRALQNECVSIDSGEYTYTHCYLKKLTQKPKRGGSETNMGNFVDITSISAADVDASLDAEDLSDVSTNAGGAGERVVLNYANGQGCWNGPSRSTKVILGCSEKETIWRVRESEKCVYEVWAGSSAVCPDSANGGNRGKKQAEGNVRDEL